MIALIFEVEPAEGRRDTYLARAASLRPLLDGIDGFISIERFQSPAASSRFPSGATRPRSRHGNTEEHRLAQQAGRGGIFRDYRLRIAHVVRDYGLMRREEAPSDSRALHDREA